MPKTTTEMKLLTVNAGNFTSHKISSRSYKELKALLTPSFPLFSSPHYNIVYAKQWQNVLKREKKNEHCDAGQHCIGSMFNSLLWKKKLCTFFHIVVNSLFRTRIFSLLLSTIDTLLLWVIFKPMLCVRFFIIFICVRKASQVWVSVLTFFCCCCYLIIFFLHTHFFAVFLVFFRHDNWLVRLDSFAP